MRVIFMGSGLFGHQILVPIAQKHNIVAVYTAKSNNMRNKKSNPVKVFAENAGISVIEIDKFSTVEIAKLRSYNPDIIIVASYGLILPAEVLKIGHFPPINVHPSLLPRWRGAAPIERCIEAGDLETGVCIIEMTPKLDAGAILSQTKISLRKETAASELYDLCSDMGAKMALDVMEKLINGVVPSCDQHAYGITYAKKIQNHELMINDIDDIYAIDRKIRAFDRVGGCYFMFKDERIKIFKARIQEGDITNSDVGTIDIQNGKLIFSGGYIIPTLMQREGKKMLPASDVWRGLR